MVEVKSRSSRELIAFPPTQPARQELRNGELESK
jgi:hypothetical protein